MASTQLTPPPKEFFRQFANLAHNRVLSEDFPHEKLLTLKYKGTGSAFVVNAKGSINIKSTEVKKKETVDGKEVETVTKVDTYPTSHEVKLLTRYADTTTEARFNNKGFVKLYTNWGVHKVGEPVEVVSVVKGDTSFTKSKIWVGAYYAKGSVGLASRLQVRREKGYSFSLAEKITYSHKDLWCGGYIDVNLSDVKVSQLNAIVGYNVNKNIHFYAEHITCKPKAAVEKKVEKKSETPAAVVTTTEKVVTTTTEAAGTGAPKTETTTTATVEVTKVDATPLLKRIGFGKGTFTGVYKDANVFALATVGWEEPTESFTAEAGAVYTVNGNSSVRAKINHCLDLTVGGRHKINKNISINVGTSIPLGGSDDKKFYNAFNTVPIPFGASLEFNF